MSEEEPLIGGEVITSGDSKAIDATGASTRNLSANEAVPRERILNAASLFVQRFQAKTVSTVLNNLEKWLASNATVEIISTDMVEYRDAITYVVIYRGVAREW